MASVIYRSEKKGFDLKATTNEIIDHLANVVASHNASAKVIEEDIHLYMHEHNHSRIDFAVVVGEYPNKREWDELGKQDIYEIGMAIERWAKARGADVEMSGINTTFDPWGRKEFDFPTSITFFTEPCKEFGELQMMATANGIDLKMKTLYDVRLFGKRGRYAESGTRRYVCYNPTECRRLTELAKKSRVKVKEIDNVEDLDLSIRYETECYGERRVTLVSA